MTSLFSEGKILPIDQYFVRLSVQKSEKCSYIMSTLYNTDVNYLLFHFTIYDILNTDMTHKCLIYSTIKDKYRGFTRHSISK